MEELKDVLEKIEKRLGQLDKLIKGAEAQEVDARKLWEKKQAITDKLVQQYAKLSEARSHILKVIEIAKEA